METIVSLLRGVNVGGKSVVRMEALRKVYEELGMTDVRTFIQSGNVVFRTGETDLPRLAGRIEKAVNDAFGIRPAVMLRTLEEWREVVAKNPFAAREDVEPAKLLVTFVARTLGSRERGAVERISVGPEVVIARRREIYVYYPDGIGRSRMTPGLLEKAAGQPGTGRNWNSVLKLLALAEGTGEK